MVIRAIYKAMENMGFRHGNILEPSCGVGTIDSYTHIENVVGLLEETIKLREYLRSLH